jgi:ribose 1,5-bisphosphate isomerase
LYQGRKTSEELAKSGIKVSQYVDSGMGQAVKEADMVFLGCDAIVNSGIINKIGSGTIAEIASLHKKPVYIIADSWKYSPKSVKIEERDFHEVWKKIRNVQINNPAFEKVDKKYIKAIISEKGILGFDEFISRS